jgi:phospholipase C
MLRSALLPAAPSGSLYEAKSITRVRTLTLLLFSLSLTLMMTSCSSGGTVASGGSGSGAANPTVVLTATPASLVDGASSSLTATASNATQVMVKGSDGSSYTMSATGGTQTITPAATTTYTATATGATGTTAASASATVTVTAAAVAPTVSISASPASLIAGASSVLTIAASNATQVTVTGSDMSSYTLPPAGGTQTVTPTANTTYTVTATGATGTTPATATATVTVVAPPPNPTVSIAASPASITAGSSSVLTVAATNATQVVVTGSDNSNYTFSPNGGTQTVTPTANTIYTAQATGAAGTTAATATAAVTVAALPSATVAIQANPASMPAGSTSTLTITATNATQVSLTGSDGSSYTLQPTGGMQSVSPASTTTYTAVASGAKGTPPVTATATVTVTAPIGIEPTVTITASPTSIVAGATSVLTVTATNATQLSVTGSDGTTYPLQPGGGNQIVTPTASTTYTATATGASGTTPVTDSATVTIVAAGSLQSVEHVIFMLQENHSFDNYFGMLNPYRTANNYTLGADGNTYAVDGIDDKLTTFSNQDDENDAPFAPFKLKSTCVDDLTSSWSESYGDVNRYDFSTTRLSNMDGFVHTAEGFDKFCTTAGTCSGTFTDTHGQRAMGYYDQNFLNYYYYMASQFALSDRWFSPVSSKSVPNRIASVTGGTTQGLVADPGSNDHLQQLAIPTIFEELTHNGISWKIYYTVTQGTCLASDDCAGAHKSAFPATDFTYLQDSYKYLYEPATPGVCSSTTKPSSAVGDSSNSFCIDTDHIAPLSTYYSDVTYKTLPSFAFIEAGYGFNDEHPGSGQEILPGQQQVAKIVNSLMNSPSWANSVFFLSYDEGGGPYDHVPPVPNHSNQNTDATVGSTPVGSIPDISTIAVDADSPTPYKPCLAPSTGPTLHCDLGPTDPGAHPTDAPAVNGFPAQLGFRVPNMIISPFTRKHYVGHNPMDHTAILRFVENRFMPSLPHHLTPRVAAQPDLLDFFDFTSAPWATPPAPPVPYQDPSGTTSCTPTSFVGP